MPARILKPHHKDWIKTELAQYRRNIEIIEGFEEKYGYRLHDNQIDRIKKKHKDLITQIRVGYLKNILDIPIAQKRVRLDRTEQQYQDADSITNNAYRINIKLKCLAHAQEEIEGKTRLGDTFLNFQQTNMFTNMTDEELLAERTKILSRIKKVKVPNVIDVAKKEEAYAPR